jgi:toxin-antitoxin system PIN domain toxin
MILVDANLLLYAYNSGAMQHQAAARWLEVSLSSAEPVRFAWATVLAFLRISTDPRIFGSPLSMMEGTAIVGEWLKRPVAGILNPGERHWRILLQLLETSQIRGPLVSDAHIAALAIEFGATLCTTDRDFRRFDGLKLLNPIGPS